MKNQTKRQRPTPKQNNIPEEVHREASRIAKNLFRLPARPAKK